MNLDKNQVDKAYKLMKELDLKEIFINENGEFFSTENLAKLSVKGDSKKFECIAKKGAKQVVKDKPKTEEKTLHAKVVIDAILKMESAASLDYDKEIKPFVKALGLTTKNNKKNTLIEALNDHKKALTDTQGLLDQKKDLLSQLQSDLGAEAKDEGKEQIQLSIDKATSVIDNLVAKLKILKAED